MYKGIQYICWQTNDTESLLLCTLCTVIEKALQSPRGVIFLCTGLLRRGRILGAPLSSLPRDTSMYGADDYAIKRASDTLLAATQANLNILPAH